MGNKLSRRGFVVILSGFIAAVSASCSRILNGQLQGESTEAPTQIPPRTSMTNEPDPTEVMDMEPTEEFTEVPTEAPEATQSPKPTADFGPRVIHVHAPSATSWDGSDPQYWNYIDQDVVNDMVDRGVMTLTGASSVADAWRAILPNYQPGQGIAIKINLNHSNSCSDADGEIVALVEPVNAVIRGLKQIGVTESDIWVYDAIRFVPTQFSDGCLYNGIQFFDMGCFNRAGFGSSEPNAYVTFDPPSGTPIPPATKITDVLVNATYLINMPIMRIHSCTGVTLSMKHHFGSIDNPSELHDYVCLGWQHYRSDYSPLVDLYRNPHIEGKTVLMIGDGLIGGRRWKWPDAQWWTFGGQVPSSLFFSTDPVAIDCVMSDVLAAETSVPSGSDDYLRYASTMGLGVYERGDPWQEPYGDGYDKLPYRRINL